MELSDFIADLDARAALIPSEMDGLDRAHFDFCSSCSKPLERTRAEYRRIAGKDYCQVCFEMSEAVSGRHHFLEAQREYNEKKQSLNKLRPGSSYL